MEYFKKCQKCGQYMTYTGGGASDKTVDRRLLRRYAENHQT